MTFISFFKRMEMCFYISRFSTFSFDHLFFMYKSASHRNKSKIDRGLNNIYFPLKNCKNVPMKMNDKVKSTFF